MKNLLFKWLINSITLLLIVHIAPGVSIDSYEALVIAALVLGLLNAFLKPVVLILTLQINFLTLGFFTLIVNAAIFYLSSRLVAGFRVAGFWDAFWGALFFTVVSSLLNLFIGPKPKMKINGYREGFGGRKGRGDVIDVEGKVKE